MLFIALIALVVIVVLAWRGYFRADIAALKQDRADAREAIREEHERAFKHGGPS